VICERGNLSLSYYPLPFQNPRSPGTSPLGLASLKRKNLPIVVTLGGIGSCYASLAFYLIAFTPSYKLCDNILAPLPGNTESILLKRQIFSVSLASETIFLQAYLATPLGCFPFSLVVSSKLSGDSTN
jgi:hypothetical protein